ncbi:MAG TPA: hypothetical protein VIL48_07860 [Acidimicrobiales bacterium]
MSRPGDGRRAGDGRRTDAGARGGPGWVRILLGVYAALLGATGAWAAAFPRSFYDDYPGFGLVWVAPDGPYNEHLVRDVGTLFLALATLLAAAAVRTTPLMVGVAAGASLVDAVPHLTYHLFNMEVLEARDQVTSGVSLVLAVVLPLGLLVWVARSAAGREESAAGGPGSATSGQQVGDRFLDASERAGPGPVGAEPADE